MPGITVTSMEKLLTKVDLVDFARAISKNLTKEIGRQECWADKTDMV